MGWEDAEIFSGVVHVAHLDQLLQPVRDEDGPILSDVPNVPSLHPSDDDDNDDANNEYDDDNDDNARVGDYHHDDFFVSPQKSCPQFFLR